MSITRYAFIFLFSCITQATTTTPGVVSGIARRATTEASEQRETQRRVVLDPAGDAKNTGRTIGTTFERAITFHCAQAIKEELEQQFPHCSVALTRTPGDYAMPYGSASFSNKLNPALHICIHAYTQTRDKKQSVTLYNFSLGDDFVTKSYDLAFIPVDQAHRPRHEESVRYAHALAQSLSVLDYRNAFITQGPYSLPCNPLIGVHAPSLLLELGLIEATDWKLFVKPLAASIAAILNISFS